MKESKIIKYILKHKIAVGLGVAFSLIGSFNVTDYKEQYDNKLAEVKALESKIEELKNTTGIKNIEDEILTISSQNEELKNNVQAKQQELDNAKKAKEEADRITKVEADESGKGQATNNHQDSTNNTSGSKPTSGSAASNNKPVGSKPSSSSGSSSNGATEPSTTYVWRTATGTKYHSINNCGKTNPANATKVTIQSAKEAGLTPCSKCY